MKLRNATFISVGILILAILGIQLFAANYRVRDNFESLEREMVASDARRALKGMQRELTSLDTILWDWASWDDMYAFVQDRDQSFFDANLDYKSFDFEIFQLLVLFDNEGEVIAGSAIDAAGSRDDVLLEGVLQTLKDLPLPSLGKGRGAGGLILLPQANLLVARRPILTSDDSGPARGSLLLARVVDDAFFQRLSIQLELSVVAKPILETLGSRSARIIHILGGQPEVSVVPEDKDIIKGEVLLNNLDGVPAFLVSVIERRRIAAQGRRVAVYDSLFLTAVLAVFSLLIFYVLQKKILTRLERLNSDVQQMDLGGNSFGKVVVDGQDEISELGLSVNRLLDRIARDHTALLQAHDGLEAEVSRRTAELEKANRELLVLDKAKTQFLSSTSHELRTPLTSIQGFLKLMNRTFCNKYHAKLLSAGVERSALDRHMGNYDVALAETNRLRLLVDDLLDLNKIEAGVLEWSEEAVEVDEIVRVVGELGAKLFAKEPDVEFAVEADTSGFTVWVDRIRIQQVLQILVYNASRFTDVGQVKLTASPHGDAAVEFSVTDTGQGIAEEDIGHVFDIFYRIQSGGELSGSVFATGLGLPLCQRILQHCGSDLQVESEFGKGTKFSFVLPLK